MKTPSLSPDRTDLSWVEQHLALSISIHPIKIGSKREFIWIQKWCEIFRIFNAISLVGPSFSPRFFFWYANWAWNRNFHWNFCTNFYWSNYIFFCPIIAGLWNQCRHLILLKNRRVVCCCLNRIQLWNKIDKCRLGILILNIDWLMKWLFANLKSFCVIILCYVDLRWKRRIIRDQNCIESY